MTPWRLHPFFINALYRLYRRNPRAAAQLVANELRIALKERRSRRSGGTVTDGGDGGLLLVPTLSRQRKLGYPISNHSSQPDISIQEESDVPRLTP